MKLRQYVITALLISIGFVLHAIVPAIFGMKFDTVLAFMMLAILLHPNKQNVLIAGLLDASFHRHPGRASGRERLVRTNRRQHPRGHLHVLGDGAEP